MSVQDEIIADIAEQIKELRKEAERLKKEKRDRDKLINDLLEVIDKYKEEHKDATNN